MAWFRDAQSRRRVIGRGQLTKARASFREMARSRKSMILSDWFRRKLTLVGPIAASRTDRELCDWSHMPKPSLDLESARAFARYAMNHVSLIAVLTACISFVAVVLWVLLPPAVDAEESFSDRCNAVTKQEYESARRQNYLRT